MICFGARIWAFRSSSLVEVLRRVEVLLQVLVLRDEVEELLLVEVLLVLALRVEVGVLLRLEVLLV